MSKLILCEGKSDAILLSYYLEKTCNWFHKDKFRKKNIKVSETKGESSFWYSRENEDLLICGVGGKNNFESFFKEKIYPMIIDSDEFTRIAIVVDHDNSDIQSITDSFKSFLQPLFTEIKNNEWVRGFYKNSFKENKTIDFLLIIIPAEKEGALETLLLDSIAENEYDKEIVKQCIGFVDTVQPIANNYLNKKRLIKKAYLGVVWAIQYPQKIFSFIDQQIRSVKWEESKVLLDSFSELIKI